MPPIEPGNAAQATVETIEGANTPAEGDIPVDPAPVVIDNRDPYRGPTDPIDPEIAELEAARAELARVQEERNEDLDPPADQGQQQQPQTQTGKPSSQQPVQIPKERLDQVARQRDQFAQATADAVKAAEEARAAAAYWKGRADANAVSPGNGQQPAAHVPQKTPAEQIADVRKEKLALSQQFDRGDLTAEEYETKRGALEDKEWGIRKAELTPPPSRQAPAQDLRLEELTAQLEQNHPYMLEIKKQSDWDLLVYKATESLAEKGQPLPKGQLNVADKLRLRTEVAAISDKWGPILTGKQIAIPGQQPAKPGQQQQTGTAAQIAAARAAKLAAAASAPPDLTATGATGSVEGEVSEASIDKMSEDEILALPKATRDRLMGRQPSQR